MRLIVLILAAIAGAIVGAALFGVIDLPGITPLRSESPKPTAKRSTEKKIVPPKVAEKPKPIAKVVPHEEPLQIDPYAGEKRLARVLAKLEPADIEPILAKWEDEDLAKQLFAMPSKQAGEILTVMKPERASKISLILQKLAADEARKKAKEKAEAEKNNSF